MEQSFANPAPDLDWNSANQRHAGLRRELDQLYSNLESCAARLEGNAG
jgi:hypothetical protein